jgi:hypothetical protein
MEASCWRAILNARLNASPRVIMTSLATIFKLIGLSGDKKLFKQKYRSQDTKYMAEMPVTILENISKAIQVNLILANNLNIANGLMVDCFLLKILIFTIVSKANTNIFVQNIYARY